MKITTELKKQFLNGLEQHYNIIIENFQTRPSKQTSYYYFFARNNLELLIIQKFQSYIDRVNSESVTLLKKINDKVSYDEILEYTIIKLSDIRYFGINGEVQDRMFIQGGGSNYGKAIIGGVLFVPAGAIIGSRNKIETTHKQVDNRKVVINYQRENSVESITFQLSAFDSLMEIIPEFEESNKQLNKKDLSMKVKELSEENKSKNHGSSKLNQLKELKELFESGIISEEEFNKIKSEILS